MDKIQRMIVNKGKKILLSAAIKEIEKYKEKIEKQNFQEIIDLFKTGVTFDIKAAKTRAAEAIKQRLLKL